MDWYMILKAFIVGGLICIIGQILIDKTKLTPARILVAYVTLGAILGGLRLVQIFSRFCWMWSYCSSYWFWKFTSKRCNFWSKNSRINWCFHWRYQSCQWWYCCCNFLWIYRLFNLKTKNQKKVILYFLRNIFIRKKFFIYVFLLFLRIKNVRKKYRTFFRKKYWHFKKQYVK